MNDTKQAEINHQIALKSLEEHELLHQSIEKLKSAAEDAQKSSDESVAQSLHGQLKEFRMALQMHIKFEEEGGFLQPALEIKPALSDQVEALKEEHAKIIGVLNELIKAYDDPSRSSFWQSDVPDEAVALIERISAHEERENAIVMDVFYYEDGSID